MQNSYDNQEKLARQNSCCASGNLEYAGFWVRMAAYMIDSVVVFAGLLIVRLIFAGISLAGGGAITGTDILFHYSLKDIVLYALKVLYFIAFTYLTGTTLGKKAMNLRVVSKNPEEKLTLFNVVYRETVGRFLCSLPAFPEVLYLRKVPSSHYDLQTLQPFPSPEPVFFLPYV